MAYLTKRLVKLCKIYCDIDIGSVCTGGRYVITKFSRMDSLPNFLTHGAPLRAGAPLLTNINIYVKSISARK